MNSHAEVRPASKRLIVIIAALFLAIGLGPLTTPSPASAAIPVDISSLQIDAGNLNRYAADIAQSGDPNAKDRASDTLGSVRSQFGGDISVALLEIQQRYERFASQGINQAAAYQLEQVADWLDDMVAAYIAADQGASAHFPPPPV